MEPRSGQGGRASGGAPFRCGAGAADPTPAGWDAVARPRATMRNATSLENLAAYVPGGGEVAQRATETFALRRVMVGLVRVGSWMG